MMKPILAAGLLLVLSAVPTLAGPVLFCEGPEGIAVEVPLGTGAGLWPLGAEIKAAGKVWATEEGKPGTIRINPAQSAAVDNRLYFDFADEDVAAVVVQIRLFWAEEETDPVYGGTLRIADHGAWPISCGMD